MTRSDNGSRRYQFYPRVDVQTLGTLQQYKKIAVTSCKVWRYIKVGRKAERVFFGALEEVSPTELCGSHIPVS